MSCPWLSALPNSTWSRLRAGLITIACVCLLPLLVIQVHIFVYFSHSRRKLSGMCDSWVKPVFFFLGNHIMGLGYFSDSIIWWIFSVSFDKILLKEGWGSLFLSMLCFFFFSFPLTKLTLCSKF